MCGIAGIVGHGPEDERVSSLRCISSGLVHRGPDGDGVFSEPSAGVALAHRRLSILDLSTDGAQPMESRCGRYAITYNGEIYNYRALRAELLALGETFRGTSDSEVLVGAISRWGVDGALRRFNGMFAFAAWDRRERALVLARDRLGQKPLYYGWVADRFVFASELGALRRLPGFERRIDRDALAAYLRHNCTVGSQTIFEGFWKLEPGGTRTLHVDRARPGHRPALRRYWSPPRFGERPAAGEDSPEALRELLSDAVELRMASDVPLGAFLSGGIDSSLVVALMQQHSSQPVRTFTIGFNVAGYNEATHAQAVAAHLGTEHTELYLTAEDARGVVPDLAQIYDEPFADVSQIPTVLVSRMAREHVTVCLSGDGGDEIFSGYGRYRFADRVFRGLGLVPDRARGPLTSALDVLSAQRWVRGGGLGRLTGPRLSAHFNADRLRFLRGLLRREDPKAFYEFLRTTWREDRPVVLGARSSDRHAPRVRAGEAADMVAVASRADLLAYLPDDILVKVDRASMSVGLEVRAPLLDYRVAELGLRLPTNLKVSGGLQKRPLQELVWQYIPRQIMDRPKMGFGVPIHEWLRGPLREWADDLLAPARLRAQGFFDEALVTRRWSEHRSGTRNWAPEVWAVLMFQSWNDANRSATQ